MTFMQDLTDNESFNSVSKWLMEIERYAQKGTPRIVVGKIKDQKFYWRFYCNIGVA
jgi:hypothetical protein